MKQEGKVRFLLRLVCGLVATACLAAFGTVAAAVPATAAAATGAITGSVDDADTGTAVPGVCVYAYPQSDDGPDPDVNPYEATTTGDGAHGIGNLPAGTYSVYFDPTCGRTQMSAYAPQYYDGAVAASGARTVDVQANVSGIDAQLVEGATVSGAVAAPGAANYAGICTYAIDPGGTVSEGVVTSASGSYALTDLAPQTYTIKFAKEHPLSEELAVSVRGGREVTTTVRVS